MWAAKIMLGPDKNIYILVGDGLDHRTLAQNNLTGGPPDGTGGILRISQSGNPAGNPPLGNTYPLNLYYAYGIRNGIAMDFDPLTGHLWDAEAGPRYGDEVNLVAPGFNSGWRPIMGASGQNFDSNDLVDFDGKGKYKDPVLAWNYTVTPTSIKFLNSSKLGLQYENDLFVGRYFLAEVSKAVLYHFNLNDERNELIVQDKIVENIQEDEENILVSGLGAITDIEVGPDGYLYLVQLTKPGGILRISPATNDTSNLTT